jgi:hypothetical protein
MERSIVTGAVNRNAKANREVQTHRDFAAGISLNSSPGRSIALGDFNGDGKRDLVVALSAVLRGSWNTEVVSVLLGNGDGTFQPPLDYASGGPMSVAVGDFNGDGVADLL